MRLAVFGAGYAGLTLAQRLEGTLPSDVELVVINENEYHLVQHEIHRAIRRPSVSEDLRVPLADCLDEATIRQTTVTDIDPAVGVATFADGDTLEYDVGVVALGAETAFYDLPGVKTNATPLKSLGDAAEIRSGFLDAIKAESATVVIGGAGLSGIQTAGELAALAREEGVDETVGIHLIEQFDTVAPNFPERFQRAVHDELTTRGVTIRTNTTVTEADDETVSLEDGAEINYDQFIWTGGIRGPDTLDSERPVVKAQLRLAGDTFVVGDTGKIIDADGEAVPASAQAAVRSGQVAAENARRLVEYKSGNRDGFEPRLENFRFDSPGWLVSVGDGAVAQIGSAVLTGTAAIALKTSVGAGYLTSIGSIHDAVDLVSEELNLATSADPDLDAVPDDAVDAIDWNDET